MTRIQDYLVRDRFGGLYHRLAFKVVALAAIGGPQTPVELFQQLDIYANPSKQRKEQLLVGRQALSAMKRKRKRRLKPSM